jgi:hypothetical protein
VTSDFWIGAVSGLAVGGLLGFVTGQILRASARAESAAARVEEIDRKADAERDVIDADLGKVLIETPGLSGKDLENAINKDFDDRPARLPAGHPQLRRPGPTQAPK